MENNKPKFRAVTSRRLTDQIASQIEELILSKSLTVGQALPPERDLAAQLHVSRNILREAISILGQKGLLEVRPGSGTYVARPSVEFLQDMLHFFLRFNSSVLVDLVEARLSLESEIAWLAAIRANEEHGQILDRLIEDMRENVSDYDSYIRADIGFHETLATAADNLTLRTLLSSIRGAIEANIKTVLNNVPRSLDEAISFHEQIAAAVKRRDATSARDAMRKHLEKILQYVKEGSLSASSERRNYYQGQ